MKMRNKYKHAKQRLAETQKQFVKGVLLMLLGTLVVIFIFGDHGLFQLYKLKKERVEIQDYILKLRKERENLIVEKNLLENNLDYIERLAREKYRMAKPGEKVFKVIPKDKNGEIE